MLEFLVFSEISVTRGDLKKLFGKLATADQLSRERLFILQVAATDGWNMAKTVSNMKSGGLDVY